MRVGINTLDDFDVKGKTVLCRVDMNQPVDREHDSLKSIARIKGCAPTVRELSDRGAKVVLMALLPRTQLKPRMGSEAALAKLPKINELIRPFADGENVIWLDLGDKMRKDGKPDTSILTDGVHPNEAGYEIWAQALKEIMQ